MSPFALRRYEALMLRNGGDLTHVDPARSKLNRVLVGGDDWAERALDEVDEMSFENLETEIEGLRAHKRKKDLRARMLEGPRDTWRPSRHGSMREVILTANRAWFEDDIDSFLGAEQDTRVESFSKRGWTRSTRQRRARIFLT